MSSDNQAQIIQCVGCSTKLRVGADAIGKTIACPKCGQQVKIRDTNQPTRNLVVARPVSEPTPQATPAPMPQSSVGNSWDVPQYEASANYQPYAAKPAVAAPPLSSNRMWLWIALGAGGFVLLLGITVAIAIAFLASPSSAPRNPPPMASNVPTRVTPANPNRPVPPPSSRASRGGASGNPFGAFPTLSPGFPFDDKIMLHRVTIPRERQLPFVMNIFIPRGEHANQSLPVMFESPSGTNLLHGADVGFPRRDTEILPFTDVGMITVTFSIDGPMPDGLQATAGMAYFRRLERAYKDFSEAEAGVASGKLAIDYVLAQIPAADPKRLYIWGHSSSATLALLMASKDARLSKCIAIAPITDLNLRLGDLLADKSMQKSLPNLEEHFKTGSPITFVQSLKCPVFVAHAKDDDNEPFENTQVYVEALRKAGGKITFEALSRGGHYQELLSTSLPKAVEWVKE